MGKEGFTTTSTSVDNLGARVSDSGARLSVSVILGCAWVKPDELGLSAWVRLVGSLVLAVATPFLVRLFERTSFYACAGSRTCSVGAGHGAGAQDAEEPLHDPPCAPPPPGMGWGEWGMRAKD